MLQDMEFQVLPKGSNEAHRPHRSQQHMIKPFLHFFPCDFKSTIVGEGAYKFIVVEVSL